MGFTSLYISRVLLKKTYIENNRKNNDNIEGLIDNIFEGKIFSKNRTLIIKKPPIKKFFSIFISFLLIIVIIASASIFTNRVVSDPINMAISLYPDIIMLNESMEINVTIPFFYNISHVEANISGLEIINLEFKNSSPNPQWGGFWQCKDLLNGEYIVTITAFDNENKTYNSEIKFSILSQNESISYTNETIIQNNTDIIQKNSTIDSLTNNTNETSPKINDFNNTNNISYENYNKNISIVDPEDEQVFVLPGTTFYVERTINGRQGIRAIFAPIFSNGLKIEKIEIIKINSATDKNIEIENNFKPKKFIAGRGRSIIENKIDGFRQKLPSRIRKLESVSYSDYIDIDGPIKVRVWFKAPSWEEIKSREVPTSGHISYLTFAGEDYDFESSTWWNANWNYRKLITINSSMAEEDFTNFPVLVYESSDSDLATFAQDDGDDISFVLWSDNTTKLNHEIESFNSSSGELVSWVNVTSLSSTKDTKLWMYYGNSLSDNQQNPKKVWDDNYIAVHHLNETTGQFIDSTEKFNGILADTDSDCVRGFDAKIAEGINLDTGNDDYIALGNIDITGYSQLSMGLWFKQDSFVRYSRLSSIRYSGGDDIRIYFDTNELIGSFDDTSFTNVVTSFSDTTNWNYVYLTNNGSHTFLYLNGEEVDNQTDTFNFAGADGLTEIGIRAGQHDYASGIETDEFRLSDIARNLSWINTTYKNINSPSSYLIFEGEEVLINTSVDKIIPYCSKTSPITVTASNETLVDNITLNYRWSKDNITWTGNWADGFEDADIDDWTVNNGYLKSDFSYSGTYSIGSDNQGEIDMSIEPTELAGGRQIDGFRFFWWEETSQSGHCVDFYDSSDNHVLGLGSENPQWEVNDGNGKTEIYSGDGYQRWICYNVTFDWSNSEYSYWFKDLSTGHVETGTRPLVRNTNIEKIQITGSGESGNYGSGDYCRFDDFETFENENIGINWTIYTNDTNPDISSPWTWSFTFPNDTGYYEFYSIGKKSGSENESIPINADTICYYNPLGREPTIKLINPLPNETINVHPRPNCKIWANDSDGDALDIYWYENSTGSYILRNSNISVMANTTVSYNFTQFENFGKTYYWKVDINDSQNNISSWFSFSTKNLSTSINQISPYIVTSNPITISAINNTKVDNVSLYYRWSEDNVTWTTYKIISIVENKTASSTASQLEINKPSEIQDGDILFAFIAKDDDAGTLSGPSGWIQDSYTETTGGRDLTTGIWYKIIKNAIDENMNTSYNWTHDNGDQEMSGGIAIVRGINISNPIDSITVSDSGTNNQNIVCPSITTLNTSAGILTCAAKTHSPSSATPPSGTDKIWSVFKSYANTYVSFYLQTEPGATGSKTWTDDETEEWHSYQISFNPADSTKNYSDWTLWSNANNPDLVSPWSWTFDFPNKTGYYEFYSIGQESGSTIEENPIVADTRCNFNRLPTISNEGPVNGSINVDLTPKMNITINDQDADKMDVNWYSNSSGSWEIFSSNNSVPNGTYHQTNSNFTDLGETYWWYVKVNDEIHINTSDIFYFTTYSVGTPYVVTNSSTGIEETNATLRGYLKTNGSLDTTCGFRFGTSQGVYLENFTIGILSSNTEFENNNLSLTPGQIYYYQAWAYNSEGFTNGEEQIFLTKPNPPNNVNISSNRSTMIFLDWTKGTGANNTYIERNQSGIISWDLGEGIPIYNDSGTNYEDSGLKEGVKYHYQAWSYANWTYDTNTVHKWSDENISLSNTTNNIPTTELIAPSPNGTTGINLNPICKIWANDTDGDTLDIFWYENSTGSYILRNTNSSVNANTTISYNFSQFNNYGITYYWIVSVNDSKENTSEWFNFKTETLESSVDTISPYIISSPNVNINATNNTPVDNVTLYYRWSPDNNSWETDEWILIFNETFPNEDLDWQGDEDDDTSQNEYWIVTEESGDLNAIQIENDNSPPSPSNCVHWNEIDPDDFNSGHIEARDSNGKHWNPSLLGWDGGWINFTWDYYVDNNEGIRFSTWNGSTWDTQWQQLATGDNQQPGWTNNNWQMPSWIFDLTEFSFRISPDAPGGQDNVWIDDVKMDVKSRSGYLYTNDTNPDLLSPWNWSFDFPNGTGYYEFYSIAKKIGSSDEPPPGKADAICYFDISWNYPPNQSSEIPINESIDVLLEPTLRVTVVDMDDFNIDAYWYSNSSGSWSQFAKNQSINVSGGPVIIEQENSNFSNYNVVYWWSMNITDGKDWSNETYQFTTGPINTSVNTISPYEIGEKPINVNAANASVVDNVTLFYRHSNDNLSWGYDWVNLYYDDFEDGTSGNYTGSGTASDYFVDDTNQVYGTYSLHLEDNTNSYWSLTNDILADTNNYTQIRVDFSWKARAFNNPPNEDWWFQYYNGSSSSWEMVYDYDCGPGTYIWDEQSGNNYYTNPAIVNQVYFFNASEGWNLSDNFNIRFFADMSGNGDELDIDNIYINVTNSSGWTDYVGDTNPDTDYLIGGWNWSFNFPNGTGYYEFYSIGKKDGSLDENSPDYADSSCRFIGNTSIEVTSDEWNLGITSVGNNNYSTSDGYFNLTNNGSVNLNVQIKASNATNSTTGAIWNLTSIPGFDNYSLQYKIGGGDWTNINLTYDEFTTNLEVDSWEVFDLNILMATSSSKNDPLSITVTFRSIVS